MMRKTIEIEACWIVENGHDGIVIENESIVSEEFQRSLNLHEIDALVVNREQVMKTKLFLKETQIHQNGYSGINLNSMAGFPMYLQSDNILSNNQSGYALRLQTSGL
jgi:hypothetical protein